MNRKHVTLRCLVAGASWIRPAIAAIAALAAITVTAPPASAVDQGQFSWANMGTADNDANVGLSIYNANLTNQNFWWTGNVTVNGVVFAGSASYTPSGTGAYGTTWSVTGPTAPAGGAANPAGQLGNVTYNFIFGGNTETVTTGNLTVGEDYVLTFYNKSWEAAGSRLLTLSATNGAGAANGPSGVAYDLDYNAPAQGNLELLRYSFTASDATQKVNLAAVNSGTTAHLSGFGFQKVFNNSWTGGSDWTTASWNTVTPTATYAVVPNSQGANARFEAQSAPTAINLDADVTVGHLRFDGANAWTVSSSSARSLNLMADAGGVSILNTVVGTHTIAAATTLSNDVLKTGAGTLVLSGPITDNAKNIKIAAGTLEIANSGPQTLSGGITGSGGLTKSGAGTLTLNQPLSNAAHSYSGPTIIAGGSLKLGTANAVIAPTAATARGYYSYDGRSPGTTFNGSGMTPSSPVTVAGHNGATSTSTCGTNPASNMWLDSTTSTWITFDLGSVQTVNGFHLWNYNESGTGYNLRGIRTAGVYTGTTLLANGSDYATQAGPAWGTLVQNFTFGAADGTTSYKGEDDTFNTPVTTRYLQIYVTGNYLKDVYTGLSEIRFYVPTTATNVLPTSTDLRIAAGSNLDMSGDSQQVASLSDHLGGGGSVINSAASTTSVLTVNPTSGSTTFSGVIGGGSGTVSLVKSGAGTQVLAGPNTHTGATTISNGKLLLGNGGSLGTTAVTVNSGGTFGVAQNANATSNAHGGSLTMKAGSAFTMADTFTSTLSVGSADLYGGTVGTAPTFTLDLGTDNHACDQLAISGAAAFTNPGATVVLNALGDLASGNTYTIATAESGLDANTGFTLSSGRILRGNVAYVVSIVNTPTSSVVTIGDSGIPKLYWSGSQGDVWTSPSSGTTNWNLENGTNSGGTPRSLTDVYFSSGAAHSNNTLGADTAINSLNFAATADAVTIGAGTGEALTMGTGGLTVASGAAAQTVNCNVALGGPQTWTNGSTTGTLTVGGNITNGSSLIPRLLTVGGAGATALNGIVSDNGAGVISLTKTGAGTLTLGGASTYSGATTIGDGTIQVGVAEGTGAGPLGTGSIVFAGGTLQYSTNNAHDYSGRLTTTGDNAYKIDTNGQTVQFDTGLAASGGSGLTKSGAGTLILTASNGYTGTTTISGGTLQVGNGGTTGTLGSGTVVNSANLAINLSTGTLRDLANRLSGTGTIHVINGDLRISAQPSSGDITVDSGGDVTVWASGAVGLSNNFVLNSMGYAQSRGAINHDGGAGTVTLTGQITLAGNSRIGLGGGSWNHMDIGGKVTGSGKLYVYEPGQYLYLSNSNNNYEGGTEIEAGFLQLGSITAAGSGTITVDNNAQLRLAVPGTLNNDLNLTGNFGGSSGTTAGAVHLSFNGDVTFAGTVTINGTVGGTATEFGAYDNYNTMTFNHPIGGTGDLMLQGAGGYTNNGQTYVLKGGQSTYTGNTFIQPNFGGGALLILDGGSLPNTTVLNITETNGMPGAFDLKGTNQTLAGLKDATGGGGGRFVMNTSSSQATLTIDNAANCTFAGVIGLNTGSTNKNLVAYGAGTGNIALVKQGSGTLTLSGANTYTGTTDVNAGTLKIAVANDRLPVGAVLAVNGGADAAHAGTFDLNAMSQTVSQLTGGSGDVRGTVTNSATGTSVLTVSGDCAFAGNLTDGGAGSGKYLALTKSTGGVLTLSGANTYTGATTVSAGTLAAGAANTLSAYSDFSVTGGTLDVSGYVNTIKSLTMTGGYLDLGIDKLLTSSGICSLGGTLNISGTPTGSLIQLMTYAAGTSGTFTPGTIPSGYALQYNANGTELDLVALGPPTFVWVGTPEDQKWATGTNWSPTAIAGKPGAANTVVTFGNTGSQPTVDLEGAGKTVGVINFTGQVATTLQSNPDSDVLSLTNSGGAMITVNHVTGLDPHTDTISVPLELNDNLSIKVADSGDQLVLSRNIGEVNPSYGLTLAADNAGTVTLSGTNNYTGGTTVLGGTLVIGSAGALPAGKSLSIGSGGTLILGGGIAMGQAATAQAVTPVPEPGTLALLAIAALAGVMIWRRK